MIRSYQPEREPVLVVVNNGYERRYFYSARQATKGLGWLLWPDRPLYKGRPHETNGEVQVYRLDVEATDALNQALLADKREHDPRTGGWLKTTAARLQTIIQNCTGIKEK